MNGKSNHMEEGRYSGVPEQKIQGFWKRASKPFTATGAFVKGTAASTADWGSQKSLKLKEKLEDYNDALEKRIDRMNEWAEGSKVGDCLLYCCCTYQLMNDSLMILIDRVCDGILCCIETVDGNIFHNKT